MPDQTGPDEPGPNQTGPDEPGPYQTGPDETGPDDGPTGQFGPHRWSAGRDAGDTGALRGARLAVQDLTGARFVDCDLSGVSLRDCWVVGVDVSGHVEGLTVNGVDVTAYVSDELDRRHPERVQLREIADADGFRAMWATVERLWSQAADRAEALPGAALHERVADEWSYVETLRHLVFITDSWASRTILDEELPYHRLALPQTAYDPEDARRLGMDLDARPSYDEVRELRAGRMAVVRRVLDTLTNAELGRPCSQPPAPGYPEEDRAVAECLAVVMEEECDHLRFALRDLAALSA